MTNVAFNAGNAATKPFNTADQRDSGAKPQNKTGMFSCFSVRNWPKGFKDAVKCGGETLAKTISGKPVGKRAIGHVVGHDQRRDQDVHKTKKSENHPVKTSSQESVELKWRAMPSDSNSSTVQVLALMTQISLISSQETTTVAPLTTPAQAVGQNVTFDGTVFAQAVKECTELVAFLNVAMKHALTEEQKTTANNALLVCTTTSTFIGAWGAVGVGFGHLLATGVGTAKKTDLLIKSIEGATKIWAAYKLHQLNQKTKGLEGQQEDIEGGGFVAANADLEIGRLETNVRRRGDISQGEAADTEPNRATALEQKYKRKLDPSIYGNLQDILIYVNIQALREGGELGVLSGVTMAPYLIAGGNFSAAVATVAVSGCAGMGLPVAAYSGTKGALALGKQVEKYFNDTGWLTSKIGTCFNAVGNWTIEMLEYALLSYGVHELEVLGGFDVKLFNLKDYSPWLSEKDMPFAAVAALLPYDADPTFWQAMIILYAWSKHAGFPCVKQGAKLINRLYHQFKGDGLPATGATPSTHESRVGSAHPSDVGSAQDNYAFAPAPDRPENSSESFTKL